jgi:uncharacterized protein (TIGR03437 family)
MLVRCSIALFFFIATLRAQSLVSTRNFSGSGNDRASLVVTDKQGFVYVAGTTTSPDFPIATPLPPSAHVALRFSPDGRTFSALKLPGAEVFAIATSADGKILLAAASQGVYRSADAGATWSLANTGLPSVAFAIALDPTDADNAYAVVFDGRMYRTVDGARTWQAGAIDLRNFPSQIAGAQLAINPQRPSTLYAATGNGTQLYRSDDAGVTWQKITILDNGQEFFPTAFALAPSDPNVLYVTGSGRLHKSVDGGVTFTIASPVGSGSPGSIAVDPRDPNVVYIANAAGIAKSSDGGANFAAVSIDGSQTVHLVTVDARDSSRLYAADYTQVYTSSDGGATWQPLASGIVQQILGTAQGVFLAGVGDTEIFAIKLDSTLSQVVYSTFVAPGNLYNALAAIRVDDKGSLYLTGNTQAHDFPTSPNAFQHDFTSNTAGFVAKISPDGSSLVYSTLLDGLQPSAIAVDSAGNAIVGGTAIRGKLPLTSGALQTGTPGTCTRQTSIFNYPQSISTSGFVLKLNPDASGVLFATYLNGSCGDTVYALDVDAAGAIYAAGETYSDDFPVTAGAMTAKFPTSVTAGFVSKISAAGDHLDYSTFFGGGVLSAAHAIALDGKGGVYIGGNTQGRGTPGAFQRPSGPSCPPVFGIGPPIQHPPIGADDALAMKLNLNASDPVFAATFGGGCADSVSGLSLDSQGKIWMAGTTASSDFDTRAPFPGLGDNNGSSVGFIAELSADGSDLTFAKIVGGGAVATGRGSDVFYAGIGTDVTKNSTPIGYGTFAQLARLDSSAVAPIALDMIVSFNQSQGLAPYFFNPPLAPGQMIRVRGRGIGPATKAEARLTADGRLDTTIGGVQVLFDGVPAPIVTAQANEIVCFTPFSLDGAKSTIAQVKFNGAASNQYGSSVLAQSPDYVAVANADGSANTATNPAPIGSTVALYVTGLGQTNPPGLDGSITRDATTRPLVQPLISVNGNRVDPAFFGAAPGEVAGITQINVVAQDALVGVSYMAVYVGNAFKTVYVIQPQ